MFKQALILAGMVSVATPLVAAASDAPRETRIPRMANFIQWVADGQRGIYVRADTGKWYYARVQGECPRLRPTVALNFDTSNGELDRYSALRIEGWRCPLESVVESRQAPGHEGR